MAKFKTLNRFLVRIGLKKKSGKEDLKRSSFWNSIWRRKSLVESTSSSYNGSSRGNKGIVKALSSIFKRRSNSKHSANHEKNELVCEAPHRSDSSSDSIDDIRLVELISDHSSSIHQFSITDQSPSEEITEDNLSASDGSDYPPSSCNSTEAAPDEKIEEECHCTFSCQSAATQLIRPEDWESSSEWLIFDVPEEPEPQIQLKPLKKVTWEDEVIKVQIVVPVLERKDDEKLSEQDLLRWVAVVSIVFILLLIM